MTPPFFTLEMNRYTHIKNQFLMLGNEFLILENIFDIRNRQPITPEPFLNRIRLRCWPSDKLDYWGVLPTDIDRLQDMTVTVLLPGHNTGVEILFNWKAVTKEKPQD